MRYTNLELVSITMKGATMYMLIVTLCCMPALAQTSLEQELQSTEQDVRSSRSTAEQASFVPQLVMLGERAYAADEFDVAATAYDYAYRIDRAGNPDEAAKHKQRMLEAKVAGREYAKIKQHVGQDDAASKRKVAEFRAFVKGDWKIALDGLALGDDAIAKAAQLDMRHLGAEEAEAVADAWVEAAKRYTSRAAMLYARAGCLYDEAAATIPTVALLKKMALLGSKIGYETAPPKGAVRVKGGKYAFSPGTLVVAGQGVDKAFDGKFETLFHTHPGPGAWLGIDMGMPRTITRFVIAPHDCDPGFQELNRIRHVGATLQVCNRPDFANAVTVHTFTEPLEQRRLTVVPVEVPGVWRYVRCAPKHGDNCALGEFDAY